MTSSPDLHQREDDAAEILGARDAPVREHVRRQETELLAGEIPAGPRQLGAGHVAPDLQTRLQILDGGEHEQEAALVIRAAPRPDPRENVVGELQLVHADAGSRARAPRRARPAGCRRGVQREGGGQLLDLRLDPGEGRLVRVGERAVDQLGHADHLGLAHAARGERGRAEPDAAGDERRLRIVREWCSC